MRDGGIFRTTGTGAGEEGRNTGIKETGRGGRVCVPGVCARGACALGGGGALAAHTLNPPIFRRAQRGGRRRRKLRAGDSAIPVFQME